MFTLNVVHVFCLAQIFTTANCNSPADIYYLDDSRGLSRRFDGIGGLSGGGATSRLLVSYPEPQRSQILDILFKPNFGASLHILKVEIGGDAQSTDGTESSHMHSADDENYSRGYEWWLMTEAKKRNPDIKLYCLSWAYPAWVGKGSNSPYAHPDITASYIVKWIKGAKQHYNLVIDYVGIWNERQYNSTYIKVLRKALDSSGLGNVQIVAADSSFQGIASDVLKDPVLNSSVSILGAHYPGTMSGTEAEATRKPLWSSEDFSTYNDDVGAGCWARILNQNFVNGNMTSTISWNLIASYYNGLPYFRDGLMTAVEPWSGHYDVMGPIWISAHTTQFTQPGFHYLSVGEGSGHLMNGGSYVTFIDPKTKDFTMVIETMSHDHSLCIRPSLPPYTVTDQSATFILKGSLAKTKQLSQWMSTLVYGSGMESKYFEQLSPIEVSDGKFVLNLKVDTVITLSTLSGQKKGSFPSIPDSKPFPLKYMDNFNDYALYDEAKYFADQSGVFEIVNSGDSHGKAMRQVVPERPITWCNDANQPITILGDMDWQDVSVSVSVRIESDAQSAFIAAQVDKGGCNIAVAQGVYLWINVTGYWNITADLAHQKQLSSGAHPFLRNTWYTLQLTVKETSASASINGATVSTVSIQPQKGFVGFGTGGFYPVVFDDFSVMAG